MITSATYVRIICQFVGLLLAADGFVGNPLIGQTAEELVGKFLPQSSRVEIDQKTKAPAAKLGRISGKDRADLAFVYKRDHQLKLRVAQTPTGQPSVLDQDIPGSFLWMQDFSTVGLQVLDLNGDGLDEVVTITSEGASLGAYLNIFAVTEGRMVSLLGSPIGGYKFQFDRTPDGSYRIVAYGKRVDKQTSTTAVYEWDGKQFKRRG